MGHADINRQTKHQRSAAATSPYVADQRADKPENLWSKV